MGEGHACEVHSGALRSNSDVTVVVPTRDKPELLSTMISSLEKCTPGVKVIIVDNQSRQPETLELFEVFGRKTNINIVKFDEDFNFSKICNFAASQVDTEYIVFANNDLEFVARDWLARLMSHLDEDGVGLVGAHLSFSNGESQHSGVYLDFHGLATHFKPTNEVLEEMKKRWGCIECSATTFALALLRTKDFKSLTGLDERFAVGLNDVDFSLRLRQSGLKVITCLMQNVIHLESQTRPLAFSLKGWRRAFNEISLLYQLHGEYCRDERFFAKDY